MNSKMRTPGWWPQPNTKAKCASGRGVLHSVAKTWGHVGGSYNYTNVYPYDTSSGINAGGRIVVGENDANVTNSGSGSPPPAAPRNAANIPRPALVLALGMFGLIALLQ